MKVTETAKTPFRSFSKIEYKTVQFPEDWGNASVRLKSMSTVDRAVWDNEKEIHKKARVTLTEAMNIAGYTREDIFVHENGEIKKDDTDAPFVYVDKWNEVSDLMTVPASAERRYEQAKRDVILVCVDTITIENIETKMKADVYDSGLEKIVTDWIISEIERESYIQKDEVTAL